MANPNQQFQTVQLRKPARSVQDGLTHELKCTADIGPLYAVGWQEILPGDYFKWRTTAFIRLQPLALPIMHDIEVYFHYFFVPEYMYNHNREKFRIPQENEGPGENQDPVPLPLHCYTRDLYDLNLLALGELNDFLGIPPIQEHIYASSADEDPSGQGRTEWYQDVDELVLQHGKPLAQSDNYLDPTQRICLYPQFCYQLIYDCYYKPEKFVESLDFDAIADMSGQIDQNTNDNIISSLCTLRMRAWEKDLFTSALPEPQQGLPAGVNMDLSDLAVSIFLRDVNTLDSNNIPGFVVPKAESDPDDGYYFDVPGGSGNALQGRIDSDASQLEVSNNYYPTSDGRLFTNRFFWNPRGSLEGRPTNDASIGFTIEEWRFAYGEQRFKEDLARAGSRITEVIRSQFGVIADDLTLNRPRYLGGGKQMIVISEVLQQSASEEGNSQRDKLGSFAGHGYSVGTENTFKARFNDFGIVMCIMSVRPRSAYGQGLPRYFSKFDRYDFFWPHLSHLGEQPVRNDEVFMKYSASVVANQDGDGFYGTGNPDNAGEFGYQPIYHDYRYTPSRIAGYMRTSLQDMHLNRMFSDVPNLNADFIQMNPRDFDHIFAVGRPAANQHLLCDIVHKIVSIRYVPKYGNPAI